MNTLAESWARAIKRADPQHTQSIEVMRYALFIILNTLFVIVSSCLIGWLDGRLGETLIALVSLAVLRMLSGGYHFRSAWACNIVSVAIVVSIPFAADALSSYIMAILNTVSIAIMLICAPRPDRNSSIPQRSYIWLKLTTVLLVGVNAFLGINVIGLAFFVQSLTVIFMRKEEKP